jgi:lipid II:glycine glycyltransferase (peptidoglycan interpeptide bridge formation enzyme)
MLVLVSDGTAYYWQGGASATYDGVSVNTLLHWRVIRDVIDAPELSDVTQYDLVGANTERICEYKRKFGGRLVPYYTVESGGIGMELAKSAYRLVAR